MKTTKQSGFFDIFELLIPVTIFGAVFVLIWVIILPLTPKKPTSTAVEQTKSEYSQGTYQLLLPSDTKLVSVDCSEGEIHILTKPRSQAEPATTYEYVGYTGPHYTRKSM